MNWISAEYDWNSYWLWIFQLSQFLKCLTKSLLTNFADGKFHCTVRSCTGRKFSQRSAQNYFQKSLINQISPTWSFSQPSKVCFLEDFSLCNHGERLQTGPPSGIVLNLAFMNKNLTTNTHYDLHQLCFSSLFEINSTPQEKKYDLTKNNSQSSTISPFSLGHK